MITLVFLRKNNNNNKKTIVNLIRFFRKENNRTLSLSMLLPSRVSISFSFSVLQFLFLFLCLVCFLNVPNSQLSVFRLYFNQPAREKNWNKILLPFYCFETKQKQNGRHLFVIIWVPRAIFVFDNLQRKKPTTTTTATTQQQHIFVNSQDKFPTVDDNLAHKQN